MKVGDKYIVEIAEVLRGEKHDIGRVKGFASMVLTDEALNVLQSAKFFEESAYAQGLSEGLKRINEKSYNAGVRQGVDHVYNACAWYIDNFGIFEVSDDTTISEIVRKYEERNAKACSDFSNEEFHTYLIEHMNPNDLENYWNMYKSKGEKAIG